MGSLSAKSGYQATHYVTPNTFDENPFTTPQKVIKETIELINQTY